MPSVAIIIPCFNQGQFIDDALHAALAQTYSDIEIVIVDDGSTDPATVARLDRISDPRCRLLRTKNRGLAAARNTAIANTAAEFILPLDADDRIAPTLVEKAVAVIRKNPSIGIVSCEAEFFGLRSGRWDLKPYSFPEILLESSLFATALFRRADWETVGGYKSDMRYGYEDYEFWLSLIELGKEVYRIHEPLFAYRRTATSMVTGISFEKKWYSYCRLYEHHQKLYHQNMGFIFRRILEYQAAADARDASASAQIFLPGENGYAEDLSVRANYVWGQWCELKLDASVVPPILGTTWRIDPGTDSALFEIAQIRIVCPLSGRALWEARGEPLRRLAAAAGTALLLPDPNRTLLFSFGTDPQLLLGPIHLGDRPPVLRIEIVLRATSELAEAAEAFRRLADRSPP